MKKAVSKLLIIVSWLLPLSLSAQVQTFEKAKNQVLDSLTSPRFLNSTLAQFMAALKKNDTSAYNFARDLNLNFKTFQANGQPPGLGFSYKYDNSWTKNSKLNDFSQSFNLDLNGNVAFKKIYNPSNFLESKFLYNGTFFWGGLAKKNTPEQAKQLIQIIRNYNIALANHDTAQIRSLKKQADQMTAVTDQFYIGINGAVSYESNQDFSKTQFVPGALINFGATSYSDQTALHWFNIPDYPFALIRWLTNTTSGFSPTGVSIPSALIGLDYVLPGQDSLRKAVMGTLNPYTRIRFEASFKTEAARVGSQTFWFSADYRWYHQLGASQALVAANIDHFNYFNCNLSSNNGFFVSYSYGQLPFDLKKSAVYNLGFTYNLGSWNK